MWYAITAIVSFIAGAVAMMALIAWTAHDRGDSLPGTVDK
jgi:hypothetical protein